MEQTLTDVSNLAISHCGNSKPIQDLGTDHSIEAQMCRTWIDAARRKTLKVIPWSFATKQIPPVLVTQWPTPEWQYAYQYPDDCLKLVRFMSWRQNNDTRQSRIPYRVMQPTPVSMNITQPTPPKAYTSTTGLWLFTNWPGSNVGLPTVIEYVFDNLNVSEWPDDFVLALSYELAEMIVTTLTTGNPQQQKQQIAQEKGKAIAEASLNNANEEQRPEEPQSEFIRARDGFQGYGYNGMTWTATPAGFSVA
jgi:hypothetical protein